MKNDTNKNGKQVVTAFLEAFSSGDVARILDAMHEDATWWVSGQREGFSGTYTREALGKLLLMAKDLYKTGALQIVPLSMIAEGNRVAVEAESHAELIDGKIYHNLYNLAIEISENKILRVREYMDTAHAYETFLTP